MTSCIYWRNSSETYVENKINLEKHYESTTTTFFSEVGHLEFMVIASLSMKSFYKKFSLCFGHALLPPYFSLGYHHSRYSFEN